MRAGLWSLDRGHHNVHGLRGGQNLTRCGPITLAALLGVAAMLCAEVSHAQQPTVKKRKAAAMGPVDEGVTEPAIAAGPDNVVAVFYSFAGGLNRRAWYAAYNLWTHQWTWAEIDPDTPFTCIQDLSIAYDQTSGRYMAAAKTPDKILTCRFVRPPDALTKGEVIPLGWEVAAEHYPQPVDKPWIVPREPNLEYGQEYYIVYQVGFAGGYHYLHSVDGGESWFAGVIAVDNDPVSGPFCAQPAVYNDRPLYVAYPYAGAIYFLVGVDQPSREVRFSRLVSENSTPPLPLNIPLASPNIRPDVPGDFVNPTLATVPYLAVDPGNPDRLFIAYHDTATADANDRDINVYVHAIVRNGTIWELGERIKVNNDTTINESDQFMPELVLDAAGYVHVLFYDDRRFTDDPSEPGVDQQPDDNCPQPKFDAYYAYAPVADLNFENHPERNLLLYLNNPSDPNEPAAFDRTVAPNANPREYNGIAWYGDRIWTAYTGTWVDDPDNKTLIWSSRIDW